MKYKCVSCNREISNIDNSTLLKCPSCGEVIARCGKCRSIGIKWKCPKCGFEGP